MSQNRRSSGGCLKAGLIGCGVVLVLFVIAVVGVTANFDLIKESGWFRSITEKAEAARVEVERSLEIRRALLERYPAEQIGVNIQYTRMNGVAIQTLAVSIESPQFEIPEDRSGLEAVARGIAREVARIHPKIEAYDRIVVRIVRRFGAGTISTSATEFVFPVDELVAGAAEAGVEAVAEEEIGSGSER